MGRIQLKDVQKTFGNVEVIPPLNLEIEDGEFVVFVGPSGCGKSTLLRLIAGLEDTTSGNIEMMILMLQTYHQQREVLQWYSSLMHSILTCLYVKILLFR